VILDVFSRFNTSTRPFPSVPEPLSVHQRVRQRLLAELRVMARLSM